MFEPRRVLRWVFIGRLSLALAIFMAALLSWRGADADVTLIASLAMVSATAFTALSVWYQASHRERVGEGFRQLQILFDVLLVTAVVHVSGGALSQFAPLYILVTLAASLLLRARATLLMAALGIALYVGDALVTHGAELGIEMLLQLAVFAAVALGVAHLSARMQEAGVNREAIEAELAIAKLRAEDILLNIRSGIVTIDTRGRIIFANPSAGAMLGFDSGTARGRTVAELIAPPAPALAAALESAVRMRERTTRGEAIISLNGRTVSIGLTTTTIEADGAPDGLSATVIFQDISDSKRLEELRLRAERLEAVAELSASLAHEIRNPLASIRSAVEQLAAASRATDDERTLGRLIVRESDRLSRLLGEFLDFARVRVARGALVDVAAIARGAAHLASTHPDCVARGITVGCDAPDEPVFVEGDEDLLHRAIFNVALNAVQAAPQGGKVGIEVTMPSRAQLPVSASLGDSVVALCVVDDGKGIPAEVRDRVFDPFFTTKAGGTGLGLAIVHRAIEAHRGLVLVDSSPRGTRLTVLLPRQGTGSRAEAA